MSTRVKQICLIILAQAACVMVGMWTHHRYTINTVRDEIESNTWSQLQSASARALTSLGANARVDAKTTMSETVQQALDSLHSVSEAFFLADSDWHIVATSHNRGNSSEPPVPLGLVVNFTPSWNLPATPHRPARGLASMPDGSHYAVAQPLAGGSGYLVVHAPCTLLDDRMVTMTQRLATVEVTTVIWITALVGLASYLILSRILERAERNRTQASNEALRRTQHLIRTRDAVIFGLGKLADSRDRETGDHLERIASYSTALATALRGHPRFESQIDESFVRLIGVSSALHDIGKVGIEDRILLKPGALTPDERKCMQMHATIGGQCLRDIERRLGSSNFLQMAREIALAHHERWDGNGYPQGLAGEAIPLAARIVAIADEYDALSSPRVYKPAYPHEICVEMITSESGKHFDPDIVSVWLTIVHEVRRLAAGFGAATERPGPARVAGNEETAGEHTLESKAAATRDHAVARSK